MTEKLNKRFEIPREQLEERISQSLNKNHDGYNTVVALKDLKSIDDISEMRKDAFKALIRSIPLRGTDICPYEGADISVYRIQPKGLLIGQRFTLWPKIKALMSALPNLFSKFYVDGYSKINPLQFYGRDKEDRPAIAFYVPPIVESMPDNHGAVLIDGIHRSTICKTAGTTNTVVHIRDVSYKPPFDPITWKENHLVDEKPSIDERYVDLDPKLFRDLGYVGIDG